MRRMLWMGALLLGLMGGFGWIGGALAEAAIPAANTTQQVAGGGVKVIATLLSAEGESTTIRLALDTYFGSLFRYTFAEIASLRDETGKVYPLTSVEQPFDRIHYRQAVLRFAKVAPEAKTIELVVKGVSGAKERTFRWSTAE